MARSFYYGKDLDVLARSQSFARKILLDPERYGLTLALAEAYQLLVEAYAGLVTKTAQPGTRTRSDVIARKDARRALCLESSRLAKLVNGTATVTTDEKVSLGLSLNLPSTLISPPGTPTKFTTQLTELGAIRVSFKCKHPGESRGTVYNVSRRFAPDASFVHIGITGKKRFVDGDIPNGTSYIEYRVQAFRANTTGPVAIHIVNIGTNNVAPMMLKSNDEAVFTRAA